MLMDSREPGDATYPIDLLPAPALPSFRQTPEEGFSIGPSMGSTYDRPVQPNTEVHGQ